MSERGTPDEGELSLIPIARLSRDLRRAASLLGKQEIRFLVDLYYQMQENRKASGNQARTLREAAEPNEIVRWTHHSMTTIEDSLKAALQVAAANQHMGAWAMSVVGVGPVLSAGLLAHIDIERAPTVSHIWSFAGLNPTAVWAKGQKRPWNARLKVLCWKIGESFVKQQNRDGDVYGHLFVKRKREEWLKNLRGDNAAEATRLTSVYKTTTDAYAWYSGTYELPTSENYATLTERMMHIAPPARHADLLLAPGGGIGIPMLPPAQVHARAKRWAVKQFLVDWHREAYREHYGKEPPMPYALEHLDGHSDFRVYGTDRYISVDEARKLLAAGAR